MELIQPFEFNSSSGISNFFLPDDGWWVKLETLYQFQFLVHCRIFKLFTIHTNDVQHAQQQQHFYLSTYLIPSNAANGHVTRVSRIIHSSLDDVIQGISVWGLETFHFHINIGSENFCHAVVIGQDIWETSSEIFGWRQAEMNWTCLSVSAVVSSCMQAIMTTLTKL